MRGCSQKASIIDILPRSTTVTDRRKFSPGSLLIRTLPSSRDREPSPLPPPLSPRSPSKQEDRPAEFCRGKNEIRGRWFDDHGMQPPWTVILEAGRGRERGGRLENRDDNPSPSPLRFQRWSNTLSLSSNVRGILKACARRIFLSSPLRENVFGRRDASFIYFLFFPLSRCLFSFLFFFSFRNFFGIFLDE